jgi:outer membrane cobalamin receptor
MITFLALVLAQASPLAQANPPPAELKIELYETKQEVVELPETIVIENRRPSLLGEASPSVSKINPQESSLSNYGTLSSILSATPGVYASEQAGIGSSTSVFFRGTNSTHTAFLLDGRRLSEGFSGNYEIYRFRAYGLSSVEILRGPSSSLYGANALGGVIDCRLPNPLSEPISIRSTFEIGSYGYASLGISATNNNAQGSEPATQGNTVTFTTSQNDGWRDNSSRDASNLLFKSVWKISDKISFDILGSADTSRARLSGTDVAPTPDDWQNDHGWLLSPGLFFQDDSTQAAIFWSHNETFSDSDYAAVYYKYRIERDELTAYVDQKINAQLNLGLGVSYEINRYDRSDSTPGVWQDTMESVGLWTRADWKITPTDQLKITLRQDKFSDFQNHFSWDIQYRHHLTKEISAHAKIATAYHTPTANDLGGGTVGNVPLRPETNYGKEIGLRYENGKDLSWTLVVFENNLTDLIAFSYVSPWPAYNINEANTRGVEFGVQSQITTTLKLFGNATFLKTKDFSTQDSLIRRPDLIFTLGAEINPAAAWTYGLSVNHIANRIDYDPISYAVVKSPNGTYWRTWLVYHYKTGQELSLHVENLFNETAPPASLGFPAQPRSFYLSYSVKF